MVVHGQFWASLMAQQVKEPPAMQETQEMWVWSPGQKDPLEKEMATHSSILARKISWTEKPGGLIQRVANSRTCLSDQACKDLESDSNSTDGPYPKNLESVLRDSGISLTASSKTNNANWEARKQWILASKYNGEWCWHAETKRGQKASCMKSPPWGPFHAPRLWLCSVISVTLK